MDIINVLLLIYGIEHGLTVSYSLRISEVEAGKPDVQGQTRLFKANLDYMRPWLK